MTHTDKALALVFPGQGSQSVGMLGALAEAHTVVAETFSEAGAALGRDLWRLVCNGPESELNSTEITQPALLAAGVAVWRVWCERGGPRPAVLAGHSLGEYTALVCAGALSFSDGVELVAARGRLMQEAVPEGEGAMAAILGLDDARIVEICKEAAGEGTVSPANYNAPGQVVVAGHRAAVQQAVARAKDAGAKRAMELAVSVPSHCALMQPAAERLAERLTETELRTPAPAVLHNVDVSEHSEAPAIREALTRQLTSPVRWTETIQALAARGITRLGEVGPGKVLAGLNRRIARDMDARALGEPQALDQALHDWV